MCTFNQQFKKKSADSFTFCASEDGIFPQRQVQVCQKWLKKKKERKKCGDQFEPLRLVPPLLSNNNPVQLGVQVHAHGSCVYQWRVSCDWLQERDAVIQHRPEASVTLHGTRRSILTLCIWNLWLTVGGCALCPYTANDVAARHLFSSD